MSTVPTFFLFVLGMNGTIILPSDKSRSSDFLVVHWLRIHVLSRRPGFNPWSRKTPRATGQPSPRPQLLSPRTLQPELHNKRSHFSQKPAHRSLVAPPCHNWRKPVLSQMNKYITELLKVAVLSYPFTYYKSKTSYEKKTYLPNLSLNFHR